MEPENHSTPNIVGSLPTRGLNQSEIRALREHNQIGTLSTVLEIHGVVLSLVLEVDGAVFGLHCDHDTADWKVTTSGDDFQDVLVAHNEWLERDIERVTGGGR